MGAVLGGAYASSYPCRASIDCNCSFIHPPVPICSRSALLTCNGCSPALAAHPIRKSTASAESEHTGG